MIDTAPFLTTVIGTGRTPGSTGANARTNMPTITNRWHILTSSPVRTNATSCCEPCEGVLP